MDSDVHVMGNCSTVECLTYNFIKRLRKAKPQTPVLLIEGEKCLGLHWIPQNDIWPRVTYTEPSPWKLVTYDHRACWNVEQGTTRRSNG